MAVYLEQIQLYCNKNKIKFTNLRKRIYQIILEQSNPIKAYEILEIFKKELPKSRPFTIYRTLDFLIENRLIHKLQNNNSYMICQHPEKKHLGCSIFICQECQNISEICNQNVNLSINQSAKNNNFKINNVTLEIGGICSSCD